MKLIMQKMYCPFTIEAFNEYEKRIKKMDGILPSTLCFESILAWSKVCQPFYQIEADYLCISVYDRNKKYMYMPIGSYSAESLESLIDILYNDTPSRTNPLYFCDVAEQQLVYFKQLKKYHISIQCDRGYSDYIYTMDDFEKSLNKTDSRYNERYFIRHYNPEIRIMSCTDGESCNTIIEKAFCCFHECSECTNGCLKDTIDVLLKEWNNLNITGIIVSSNGEDIGYAAGTMLNDVFVFLFKKNCRKYRGLSEYLHRMLFERLRGSTQFINYTEDMNLDGLRKYKQCLAPYLLKPKYKLEIERLDEYEKKDN